MVEDEPKASVHSLQTLLLINHFSRSYCSLKEHDISQVSPLFQVGGRPLILDLPLAVSLHDQAGWYLAAQVSPPVRKV
jgi:hypothetical protein